ncbi:MAG: DUF6174 domain-containing protein [Thainema sp.]
MISTALMVGFSTSTSAAMLTQAELNANRNLWEENKPEAYSFVVQNGCFCLEDVRGPHRVSVVDGEITDVVFADSGEPYTLDTVYTIDGYFDILQTGLDEDWFSLEATFDPDLGFPLTIAGNPSAQLADEEVFYTISDFNALQPGASRPTSVPEPFSVVGVLAAVGVGATLTKKAFA